MAGRTSCFVTIGFLLVSVAHCATTVAYAQTTSGGNQHYIDNITDSQVRLVDGPNYYSGRVEVYYNGEWGTICDDHFDHNDVMVICRMLGLYQGSSYGQPYSGAYFGQGNGSILLDEVNCGGYERNFETCTSNPWYSNDCSHSEDVGVDCHATVAYAQTTSGGNQHYIDNITATVAYAQTTSGGNQHYIDNITDSQVRLVDGPNYYSGRVEVYYNGEWGTICDDHFDHNDVMVICRMLGLYLGSSYGQPYSGAYFGQGNGSILLDEVNCGGYERNFETCTSNPWYSNDCSHSEDVGVDCHAVWQKSMTTDIPGTHEQTTYTYNTQVRLVGGPNYYSGRVEVYHKGTWGTICDDQFDHNDVMVICRMLGFYQGERYGQPYLGAYYGQGRGYILLDEVNCGGYESNVDFCTSNPWYSNDCSHSEDAGVDCHAVWQKNMTTDIPGTHEQTTNTYNTQVRLVDGPNYYSGRVEVYHNGEWGTICDDQFDHNDVIVICRMLGLYRGERHGRPYSGGHYGQGNGSILLDEVNCGGYESNIDVCTSNPWYRNDCGHSEDAGVDCYAVWQKGMTTDKPGTHEQTTATYYAVRLVNGPSSYSGRVEVYHNGAWGTVCDDEFDHSDAKVICRMLGLYRGESYGRAYANAHYGEGVVPIMLDNLFCFGYESDIGRCRSNGWGRNNCGHMEDAGVDCMAHYRDRTSSVRPTNTYSTYPWWLTTSYHTRYTTFPWGTTTYNSWYHQTTVGSNIQYAVGVSCNEYSWDIKVDMNRLRYRYPAAKASDIYLGENKCTGIERNGHLTFQHGLGECLTSETLRHGVHVYSNELIYAEHDPVYLFIIRHYNWTFSVECDVYRDGSASSGIHNYVASTPYPSVSSQQYPVNISLYRDPNYMTEVSGNPLHATVGSQVYVKVFTTALNWNTKLRLHTCYTKPTQNAPDHLKYYLVKNGCEVDTNTHIISQSTHETRFMFDDFEYSSNHDGIYVFCYATFCKKSDWSPHCRQTCNPVVRSIGVEKKVDEKN